MYESKLEPVKHVNRKKTEKNLNAVYSDRENGPDVDNFWSS